MKLDIFAGLNLNINSLFRKKRHKNGRFTDDALKAGDIKSLNVETWLFFAFPYQNFWLRACINSKFSPI